MEMNGFDKLAWLLVVVGGLNWGLIGFFGYDLVGSLLGTGGAARVVYIVVGVATLWSIYKMATMKKK